MKRILLILVGSLFISVGNLFAQNFPTVNEVYNYEIGDEFHVKFHGASGGGGYSSLKNIEILDKTYFEDNTIVSYTIFVKNIESGSDYPEEEYSEYFDTISYIGLNNILNVDSVIINSDWYNGRKTAFKVNQLNIYTTYTYRYVVSCGRVYYEYDSFEPEGEGWAEEELVYFKKGNEEWGEKLVLVGVDVGEIEASSFVIFPNPVQSQLYISSNTTSLKKCVIHIYNSTGQMVNYFAVSSDDLYVDMSSFSNGFYYVTLIDKDGIVLAKQKFLKI